MVTRPDVLAVLEPGYDVLFDRAVVVFEADERVRALWLSGSLGRGDADAMSDLDLIVAVDDAALAEFADSWREWLASITPTLIARALPFLPGSLYAVTSERLRLDVVVEPASRVASSPFRHRALVFDRDGLDTVVPPPDKHSPSPERVAGIIEEFFRDTGMFPVVLEREDWLLGLEGIHLVRGLLYQLFVEMNAPLPPMGLKQWSAKLTPTQRAELEALPTGGANRESIVAAHDAVVAAFERNARLACGSLDIPWPAALADATHRYLRAHGIATPD
ncbi:MAG TPA: nucleotidyltransferase domain-containing protein [Acidimicrobiales bacterium]|nr:nucleotidyltransferase domain-containing protein [Acidimicrobiales bacterium]